MKIKKLIIYLDQNFISDIAKFRTGLNIKTKKILDDLFEEIRKGVNEDKFVVPDSYLLKTETAAFVNERLIRATREHQKYLGQISLNLQWEIFDFQFEKALLDYLKIKKTKSEYWKPAFRENPDQRLKNFDVDVNFPHIEIPDSSTANLQQIRRQGVNYKEQYSKEVGANRIYYKNKLLNDYKYILFHHKITKEQAEQFIDSEKFLEIPNLDIFMKLWSKDLSNKSRKGKRSDFNDIEMLSAYLPYCDIIATDNYMKCLVEDLKLDTKYNCKIFSMKDDSSEKFILKLQDERKNRKPANSSLFSVICCLENGQNFFKSNFINKINLARNKFTNTGKYWNKDIYVSVYFLFNKNELFIPNIIKGKNKKHYIKMDEKSAGEMQIFGLNFLKLYKNNLSIEGVVKNLPLNLKGQATAIVYINSEFDNDLQEHDSYLFYDIEEAIKNKQAKSERYKIDILYS